MYSTVIHAEYRCEHAVRPPLYNCSIDTIYTGVYIVCILLLYTSVYFMRYVSITHKTAVYNGV